MMLKYNSKQKNQQLIILTLFWYVLNSFLAIKKNTLILKKACRFNCSDYISKKMFNSNSELLEFEYSSTLSKFLINK